MKNGRFDAKEFALTRELKEELFAAQKARIAAEASGKGKAKRRSNFKAEWVKLPWQWAEALRRSDSVSAYRLAHTILFEAFKREQVGGEIVLSGAVTGLPSTTRVRAAEKLEELGLIKVSRHGKQAFRIRILYKNKK